MYFECCFFNFTVAVASILSVLLFFYHLYSHCTSQINLDSKHIVITGGSSGIGKSFACEVAKRGANVTIVARNETRLKEAKELIEKSCLNKHQKVQIVTLDVNDDFNLVKEALSSAENLLGPIFMLFNCAGTALCGTLENLTATEIKSQFEVNTVGSIIPTKAVVKGMMERKEGHIIFTASQGAYLGIYGLSAYCASKFALRGFAEALRMEVLPYGIKVTIAFPPDTDTPGFAEEEKRKPEETRLISQTSGLFQSDDVARKILNDALLGKFSSNIGLDGFLLSNLCSGMSPVDSPVDLLIQVCLMGVFRLIGVFHLISFKNIVQNCFKAKAKSKSTKSD